MVDELFKSAYYLVWVKKNFLDKKCSLFYYIFYIDYHTNCVSYFISKLQLELHYNDQKYNECIDVN